MQKRGSGHSLFLAALAAGLAAAVYRQQRCAARRGAWIEQTARNGPGTAFITGASSGIGAAFARALAQEGYNLVLSARREDRLQALAEALRSDHAIWVDTLTADLSEPADQERAATALEAIPDLSLLVNNAGFGTGGRFASVEIEPELKMIRLHVTAPVRLTRAALPGMIRRGQGGVIHVSSVAGLVPLTGNATYGATKSYLIFFSESLQAELAGTGVRVQALCPGFTYSEFHDVAKMDRAQIPQPLWMQAEDVVRESLQGLREDRWMVIPGAAYRAAALLLKLPFIRAAVRRARSRIR